jgi:hypothetical protein
LGKSGLAVQIRIVRYNAGLVRVRRCRNGSLRDAGWETCATCRLRVKVFGKVSENSREKVGYQVLRYNDFTLFNSSKLHRSAGKALASYFRSSAVFHGSKSDCCCLCPKKRRTYTLRVCSFLAGMNGNPSGAYGYQRGGVLFNHGPFFRRGLVKQRRHFLARMRSPGGVTVWP